MSDKSKTIVKYTIFTAGFPINKIVEDAVEKETDNYKRKFQLIHDKYK
jgi:hypothetical protein